MTVVRYADDGPTADGPVEVAPGASLERELQPGESSQAVSVRWTGGPTVATWRVDGERTAAAPCAAGPSERWHLAALDTAESSTSRVHLFNPFPEDAVARVRFAVPDGAIDLVLTDTILVPAETAPRRWRRGRAPRGGTRSRPPATGSWSTSAPATSRPVARIDLDQASAAAEFGVTVTVENDTPVVVAGTTSLETEDGREGVATALAEAPAQEWAVAGAGTDERLSRLAFVNPGARPVTVEVLAGEAPEAWSAIEVAPNGRGAVELGDAGDDRAGIGLRVRADGPIVPQVRTFSTSTLLRLWTVVATPAEDWRGPETRPAVRRDPGLATAPLRPAPTPEPDAPPAPGEAATVPETATVPVGPGPTDALTAQPQEPDPDA